MFVCWLVAVNCSLLFVAVAVGVDVVCHCSSLLLCMVMCFAAVARCLLFVVIR